MKAERPDIVVTGTDKEGTTRTYHIEVKNYSHQPGTLNHYVVGPGRKVIWIRSERKPSFLHALSAKSAAYGLFETERDEMRSLSKADPQELERRLESIQAASPWVGWFFSDLLAREGIISVGEPRSRT